MTGIDTRRLVLLQIHVAAPTETVSYSLGSGYFVTDTIVLTASHVVPISGVTKIEVRTEADARWRLASVEPLWRDEQLDATLIEVTEGLQRLPPVQWIVQPLSDDAAWTSSGYPRAARANEAGHAMRKTVGLSGTLYHQGGAGQGSRELDLSVDASPSVDDWPGISGAPVSVAGRLAGFIRDAPESFGGARLIGVPASSLFQSPGFRLALSPPWLNRLPTELWVLVVLSEQKKSDLGRWVDGSLKKHGETLRRSVGVQNDLEVVKVKITDALESPERWLRFVAALCKAPIAIFDATDYRLRSSHAANQSDPQSRANSGLEPEPAIMLALGVRAVVRRGVTLTSTADVISEKNLSQLPFNVQESKLIHHGSSFPPNDVRHPLHRIGTAIIDGWQELQSQPRYLDLPAYDAVRGPVPSAFPPGNNGLERVLVLCPFRNYDDHWLHIAGAVARQYPTNGIARMLDIASPRLVGQALYESIRWAKTCVVDWTRWRANVFFELGVRSACTSVSPVCLIEHHAESLAVLPSELRQKSLLLKLYAPTSYELNQEPPEDILSALATHEAISGGQALVACDLHGLPNGAVYKVCEESFEWSQEHITVEPHEHLRQSVEAPFGKDRQISGRAPILFSTNAGFRKELEHSVRERWIAAWYYLRHRYPREQWRSDSKLRATLRKLGNDVLQYGVRDMRNPHLTQLRAEIEDVLDELDELDDESRKDT